MKKKILFLFIILFAVTSVFAYEDMSGDMSGAIYNGKSYEMDFDRSITQLQLAFAREVILSGYTIYEIKKLSNRETQLLKLALEEYNLQKDDVYTVQIGIASATPMRILKVVVRIDSVTNNGRSYEYSWYSVGKFFVN